MRASTCNNSPAAKNTLSVHILVFNAIFKWKKLGAHGEIVDLANIGAGHVQDGPEAFHSAWNWVSAKTYNEKQKKISNGRGMSKGHRYQMKEFPVAKYKTIWATHAHSHTTVLEHNPKYKMNIDDEYVNEENKHIFWAKRLQIIYAHNPTSRRWSIPSHFLR